MSDENRICGSCYKKPDHGKILYCQHVFCLKCLKNCLLGQFEEKVRKNGIICPLCPVFTPLNVKIKKKFNLNPLQGSNSKRLSIVDNLDSFLPDYGQITYKDTGPPPVSTAISSRQLSSAGSADLDLSESIMTSFHRDFLTQSSLVHNPCVCTIERSWKCLICNETFCEPCSVNHWEKPVPEGFKDHEVVNQSLCLYCSGTKSWQCLSCDKALCSTCLQIHLDQFDKHEVVDVAEQSVAAFQYRNGASSSTSYDVQVEQRPTAPIYFPSTESKINNEKQRSEPKLDVKSKYEIDDDYRPPASYEGWLKNPEDTKYDVDYRPPAEYEGFNKKCNVLSFDSKPPPPVPMRPPSLGKPKAGTGKSYPPDVKIILQISQPMTPKKFCIDSGGQIFILFIENDQQIFRFDRHSGTSLSTINNEMTVVDMNYNEKNDTLLVLSHTLASHMYFLQKYSVFSMKLVDVFELGSEVCGFVIADKKHPQRAYITMKNKIKVYNFVSRAFERTSFVCNESMPDTSTLLGIEGNEKGSLYLLFNDISGINSQCTVYAYHTLPVAVIMPMPLTSGVQAIAVNKNNMLCFADPQTRRILLFGKDKKLGLFAQFWGEVCESNKYSWKPQLLTVSDDELLILDVESKTLYSWTVNIQDSNSNFLV